MIFETAEKFPPCVCRLAARKKNGWRPMSCLDIARAAKLSKSYVAYLSTKTTWKGVPIDVVERFSKACGVDLISPKAVLDYFRESKMIHTRNCSKTQKRFFLKLFSHRKNAA